MKRITVLLLAASLCLSVAACGKEPEPEQSTQEIQTEETNAGNGAEETRQESDSSSHSGSAAVQPEETTKQSIELAGPWHLDREKNDLAAYADRFPGYVEWGASLEIGNDGLMNWYIGAEGWHGTYVLVEDRLHAELDSELEALTLPWDFQIVTENESAMLEMGYEDMTIYWVYGEQEDPAVGNENEP